MPSKAMQLPRRGVSRWMLLLPLAIAAGCASTPEPTDTSVATSISSAAFVSFKHPFASQYPLDWKTIDKGGDYELAITPKDLKGTDADPTVGIQVPDLPPHIPNLIPLGPVADGYVNDLKKRYPDQKTDEIVDAKLDGANGRRITSTFQKDRKPFRELALLSVHQDHVYVITGTCPADGFDKTKKAFENVVSSWKWRS